MYIYTYIHTYIYCTAIHMGMRHELYKLEHDLTLYNFEKKQNAGKPKLFLWNSWAHVGRALRSARFGGRDVDLLQVYVHTYIRIYIHTYIRTYVYTYIRILMFRHNYRTNKYLYIIYNRHVFKPFIKQKCFKILRCDYLGKKNTVVTGGDPWFSSL